MSINDVMVLRGRVGTNLILHRPDDEGGRSFARFRMVVPRARRKDDGQWEEGEPQWYTVRAWGTLAENMTMSLRKGHPILVIGRPAAYAWASKDGELRAELAINAFSVGHDLGYGASLYRRIASLRGVEDALVENGRLPQDEHLSHDGRTPHERPTLRETREDEIGLGGTEEGEIPDVASSDGVLGGEIAKLPALPDPSIASVSSEPIAA